MMSRAAAAAARSTRRLFASAASAQTAAATAEAPVAPRTNLVGAINAAMDSVLESDPTACVFGEGACAEPAPKRIERSADAGTRALRCARAAYSLRGAAPDASAPLPALRARARMRSRRCRPQTSRSAASSGVLQASARSTAVTASSTRRCASRASLALAWASRRRGTPPLLRSNSLITYSLHSTRYARARRHAAALPLLCGACAQCGRRCRSRLLGVGHAR